MLTHLPSALPHGELLQQPEDSTVGWKEKNMLFRLCSCKERNDNLGKSYLTENSISNVRGELRSRKQVRELVLNSRKDTCFSKIKHVPGCLNKSIISFISLAPYIL